MIRHTIAEGWLLVRSRALVSLILALALAVPICLSGVTLVAGTWLRPLTAYSGEKATIAVLLHPQMDDAERDRWLAEQTRLHPEWTVEGVPPERLAARLGDWFPYLEDLLAEDAGGGFMPPLVEITTADVHSVDALESSTAVVAIGPRSSVHRLIGGVAREAGWILAALTAVLLAAAVALAAVWVHLEIYRHADEINIMRLVGATEAAIKGPFLFAVTVPGVLAALLSVVGTVVAAGLLSDLTGMLGLAPVALRWWVAVLQVGLGCLLPMSAGMVALSWHAHTEIEA